MTVPIISNDKWLVWLHAKTKLFTGLAAIFFVLASLVLWALPGKLVPGFYDRYYMIIANLLSVGIIYGLPRLFAVPQDAPDAPTKNQVVDYFQLFLTAIIMGDALGNYGLYELYKVGFEFDKLLHFAVTFSSLLILPRLVEARFSMRPRRAMLLIFFIIISCGVLWEVYEFLADFILGTHLFGVFHSGDISQDTKMDLLCDVGGSTLGLMVGWVRKK